MIRAEEKSCEGESRVVAICISRFKLFVLLFLFVCLFVSYFVCLCVCVCVCLYMSDQQKSGHFLMVSIHDVFLPLEGFRKKRLTDVKVFIAFDAERSEAVTLSGEKVKKTKTESKQKHMFRTYSQLTAPKPRHMSR